MPRTPAPLTVDRKLTWRRKPMPRGGTALVVEDQHGTTIANFAEEADARAFVALPALAQALRSIANSSCCGCCQEAAQVAKAALAAADGPSQEQG